MDCTNFALLITFFILCVFTVLFNLSSLYFLLTQTQRRRVMHVILISVVLNGALNGMFFLVDVLLFWYGVEVEKLVKKLLTISRNLIIIAAVLHLLLLTADRNIAVLYPLRHDYVVTKGRAVKLIVFTYLLSFLMSLHFGDHKTRLIILSVTIIFVACFIITAYVSMFKTLHTSSLGMARSNSHTRVVSSRKPGFMFMLICGVFLCFNLPSAVTILCLYSRLGVHRGEPYESDKPVVLISMCLLMCSWAMNPIVYIFSNKRNRKCCWLGKKRTVDVSSIRRKTS